MRRIAAWIGGVAGAALGYRFLRRRHADASETVAEPDERADELRAKLAETREEQEEPVSEEPGQPESPEERRRRVHEQGRAAIDEMGSE